MVKSFKKNISISEEQDRSISFAIILQFCLLITNYTFKQIFNITNPSTRSIISVIFMMIVGIIFISKLHIVFRRIGKLFIGVYISFICIVLFNILLFSQNTKYIIDISFYIFLICIPIFLYYLAIEDKSIFLQMIVKSAYYQIALAIIFFMTTDFLVLKYDMVYSYLVLVPITILLYKVFNDFHILDVFLILFGVVSIVILGSRGPILAFMIYFLIVLLNNSIYNKNILKNMVIFTVSITALILFILYYQEILFKIDEIFQSLGFKSRTIMILLTDNIDFSSGRDSIYKYTLEQIIKRPLLGYGLAGDRIFLNGTYPHNIILELLVHFGIIGGSLIIITFIFYWFKGMILNNNRAERDLAIMFFGIGLVQLFVSGSYITSSNFWLFMAICIDSVHFKKVSSSKVKAIKKSKIQLEEKYDIDI